jgi:hypothetical protein
MEVHAHSHTARKKWTHYFWEFLMLFLAVFCGFLAENFREHQIEHNREKAFIKSFIADLQSDTAQIAGGKQFFEKTFKGLDTLMTALKAPDAIENPKLINDCFGYAKDDVEFISSDRTILQLKNGGNMRLIRKQLVSDSIIFYDQMIKLVYARYQVLNISRNDVMRLLDEVIDENTTENSRVINREMLSVANPKKLITKDRYKLDMLFNKIKRLKGQQMDYANVLDFLKSYAGNLIVFIRKEYHLK